MPCQFRELHRKAVLRHEDQVGERRLSVPWTKYGVWMQLRYRYRLDPTLAQRQALARAFGCARVVYNDGLRLREDAYRAGLSFVGGWSCPDRSSRSPSRPQNRRG